MKMHFYLIHYHFDIFTSLHFTDRIMLREIIPSILVVNSAKFPLDKRKETFNKLATNYKFNIDTITKEYLLEDASYLIDEILQGKILGRALIKIS